MRVNPGVRGKVTFLSELHMGVVSEFCPRCGSRKTGPLLKTWEACPIDACDDCSHVWRTPTRSHRPTCRILNFKLKPEAVAHDDIHQQPLMLNPGARLGYEVPEEISAHTAS